MKKVMASPTMTWCPHCQQFCNSICDGFFLSCAMCGRVYGEVNCTNTEKGQKLKSKNNSRFKKDKTRKKNTTAPPERHGFVQD